jgi:1,4-dihydroxy-2-naphthoate octaprenyltransferase
VVLAGVRRTLQILIGIAAPTAVFSALLGLAFGTAVTRALATGFYLVGSLIMLVGILSGVRGPVRSMATGEASPASLLGLGFAGRRLRTASEDERRDAVFTAILFLFIGLALIALGVIADPQVKLF